MQKRHLPFMLCAVLISAIGLADDNANNGNANNQTNNQGKDAQAFEKIQKRILANLDKRMRALEDAHDCVAAATDMASLRACKPAAGKPAEDKPEPQDDTMPKSN